MNERRLLAGLTAILLVAGVVSAAVMAGDQQRLSGGGGAGGTTLAVGDDVPIALLASASERMAKVSYKIDGTMEISSPSEFGERSGRLTIRHDADSGRWASTSKLGDLEFGVVFDGTYVYFDMPFGEVPEGKRWVRTSIDGDMRQAFEGVATLSGQDMLDRLVEEGGTVTFAGRDRVRGADTDRYTIDARDAGNGEIGEVWIDDDGRVRRMRVVARTDETSSTVDMEVYDIGDDVHVDVPDESDVHVYDESGTGGAPESGSETSD